MGKSVRLLCIALLTTASLAEAVVLSGVVVNERDLPLPYAPVRVQAADPAGRQTGVHADSLGAFRFTDLPPAAYSVSIHYVGHRSWNGEVDLSAGDVHLRAVLPSAPLDTDDVTVTASRRPQTSAATCVSFDVSSERDLTYRNVGTVDQALECMNGLQVFRSHSVATNSVSIRGSSDVLGGGVGNRVLLLMDGRPALIPASSGQAWSLLPLGAVARVEVVKGAFSALYGSNAMGGVINLITRSPGAPAQTTLTTRAGFYEPPADWMEYRDGVSTFTGVDVLHSARHGVTGYLVSLSREASDGFKECSDYTVYQAFAKADHAVTSSTNATASGGFGWSRAAYPHRWRSLVEPLKVKTDEVDDRQNKEWWNADVIVRNTTNGHSMIEGAVYTYGSRSTTIQPASDERNSYTSQRVGARVLWQNTFGERWTQSLGADGAVDGVNSDSVLYGDRTAYAFSAFSLTQVELPNKAQVELGVRYDNAGLPGSRREHQINPKLGLAVPLGTTFTARASVGRAFRMPSIAERFLVREPAGGTEFEPNDSLRAEKMVSYELGITHELAPYLRFDVAGFINDYSDWIYWREIAPAPGSSAYRFQVANLLKVRMSGMDARARIRPAAGFEISLNYLYLLAKDRTAGRSDNTLPYRPRHTLSGSVLFHHGDLHSSVTVRGRSSVEETVFAAYKYDTPGAFAVTDLHTDYDVRPWMNVALEVDNVFNVQYEEMARYRLPGRSYAFVLKLTR